MKPAINDVMLAISSSLAASIIVMVTVTSALGLIGAWMTLLLLPVFAGLWQVRGLCRSGLPWRRGQSVAEMVAVELGIHRRVEVLLHEAVPGPMTCGAANPAIVLSR